MNKETELVLNEITNNKTAYSVLRSALENMTPKMQHKKLPSLIRETLFPKPDLNYSLYYSLLDASLERIDFEAAAEIFIKQVNDTIQAEEAELKERIKAKKAVKGKPKQYHEVTDEDELLQRRIDDYMTCVIDKYDTPPI